MRQFLARTVDFGASDAPMTAEEVAKAKQGVVQLPLTASAIAVAYNLPGCELKLSQAQLVGIFEGKIKNFTSSLVAFSPSWKAGPGSDKSVNWPTGVAAKGNEGVAASLLQRKGGLGYVEVSNVREPLQAAAIANAAGTYAKPDNANASQALVSIELGPDLTGSNPNPATGYPIVTFTWVLLNQNGNGAKQESLQKAFGYGLSDGAQAEAPKLGYITLPGLVLTRARQALTAVKP